jgi:alkanesulfonate monooxygenase SsuD/methylene tetrahydromethanopterin reductase-like flavin-dependent oxidoreductase (luciferase family)
MRILFLHQNFPGQFLHVAAALQASDMHNLLALTAHTNPRPPIVPVRTYQWRSPNKQPQSGLAANYIAPMWHPLRLAEDYAVADILTKGRTVFGVGRGYHSREVESFGAPIIDQDANRELFEEQVEIIFKAFNNESFSHRGKHYTLPPEVPYRGYTLKELTLVPRPVHLPVECWQPVVSASARGLDFMVRHGIKGAVGGGAATLQQGPISAYRDAAARAGQDLKLGENLMLGVFFHLADTREKAVQALRPLYEEHAKMFAPLGFLPGATPAQVAAIGRRGGWYEAGVPTLEDYMKTGAWFAGPPEKLVAYLKELEARYPGMQHINLSTPMGTPEKVMLDQFQWVSEAVMPAFRR